MSAIKLGGLLLKTLAKPITANFIERTKTNPKFKDVCVGVAQFYHRTEMRLKMNVLGYKTEAIRPLNTARAVEVGAEFLSQGFVFFIGATVILLEQTRSRLANNKKEALLESRFQNLEKKADELRALLEQHQAQVESLSFYVEGLVKDMEPSRGIRKDLEPVNQMATLPLPTPTSLKDEEKKVEPQKKSWYHFW